MKGQKIMTLNFVKMKWKKELRNLLSHPKIKIGMKIIGANTAVLIMVMIIGQITMKTILHATASIIEEKR